MSAFTAYDDSDILDDLRSQVSPGALVTDEKTVREHSFSPLVTDSESGMALALVEARSSDDVKGTLRTARRFHRPVVTQDRLTSTVIGADGIKGSILLSTAKMDKIIEINPQDCLAVVEPGVINADLDDAARKVGMFFAPDPGGKKIAGVGGNVATNAGGMSTVKYGSTRDNVLGLTVILADGRELKLGGRTLKQAFGYDLTHLFVGSEGTLGVITQITVKLIPIPLGTPLMGMASFSSMGQLAQAVAKIRTSGIDPTMLEAFDHNTLEALDAYRGTRFATSNEAMLFFKVDSANDQTREVMENLLADFEAKDVRVTTDSKEQDDLMTMRWDMLPAVFHGHSHIMEDMAVPLSKLAEMVDYITELGKRLNLKIYTAGHAGDGNVHPTIIWPKGEPTPRAVTEALRLMFSKALELGGTISGEHSVGMLKNKWNNDELGGDVDMVQHQIKALLDPMNILNPKRKIN